MNASAAASRRQSYRSAVLWAMAVTTVLRVRFVFSPLMADEGGALSVARLWRDGGVPYRDIFVDRPQGVLVMFRTWDALPGTGVQSVRMLAIVAGLATVWACASIARSFGGPRAGAIAAWIAALAGGAPIIEGFAANGELLAAGWSLPGIAVAVGWMRGRWSAWWLPVAGVLSGTGLTVKQSAFEGIIAFGVWCVIAAIAGWRRWPVAIAAVTAFAAGVAAPLAASALHGRSIGWDDYWYAMAGFRGSQRSGLTHPEWLKLGRSILFALPVFAPLVWLAGRTVAGTGLRRAVRSPTGCFVAVWAAVALAAFATGGSFHRHYFLILVWPVAVACGLLAARRPDPAARPLLVTTAIALVAALPFVVVPSLILGNVADTNVDIARWIHTERREGGPLTIYAYCASAAMYSEIGDTPVYPYLWADHVRLSRDGQARLAAYLTGPDAPDIVARFQRDSLCDAAGTIAPILAERYVRAGRIGDATLLHRRDSRELVVPAPGADS